MKVSLNHGLSTVVQPTAPPRFTQEESEGWRGTGPPAASPTGPCPQQAPRGPLDLTQGRNLPREASVTLSALQVCRPCA